MLLNMLTKEKIAISSRKQPAVLVAAQGHGGVETTAESTESLDRAFVQIRWADPVPSSQEGVSSPTGGCFQQCWAVLFPGTLGWPRAELNSSIAHPTLAKSCLQGRNWHGRFCLFLSQWKWTFCNSGLLWNDSSNCSPLDRPPKPL